jgi:hypothetical protein
MYRLLFTFRFHLRDMEHMAMRLHQRIPIRAALTARFILHRQQMRYTIIRMNNHIHHHKPYIMLTKQCIIPLLCL